MQYLNGCNSSSVDKLMLRRSGIVSILNFVLFSEEDYYQKMYEITSPFYKKFKNVKTIYYRFADIDEEYVLNDDVLLIKGKEHWHNIFNKTMKTFNYFREESKLYDYVVRTNVATIVNFDLLSKYLYNYPILYGGDEIHNRFYTWVRGTCIIMNTNFFHEILEKQDKIEYVVVDDTSLGNFVNTHFGINQIEYMVSKKYESTGYDNTVNFFNSHDIYNYMYFRHKTLNRYDDIKTMKFIVNKINVNTLIAE